MMTVEGWPEALPPRVDRLVAGACLLSRERSKLERAVCELLQHETLDGRRFAELIQDAEPARAAA